MARQGSKLMQAARARDTQDQQTQTCKNCWAEKPIYLDACPHCGHAVMTAKTVPNVSARKVPKAQPEFVCSDCGGDISELDKACPHCGASIKDN